MNAKMVVANNIKRLIKERGISQTDLARAIDMEAMSIHYYTTGQRFPKPENIDAICAYFRVSLCELFLEENKQPLTNEEILNALASNLGFEVKRKA